jgi:hypothetical protein
MSDRVQDESETTKAEDSILTTFCIIVFLWRVDERCFAVEVWFEERQKQAVG